MYKNCKRIMAWIAKINKVELHPNADNLDICTIGGWKCIAKHNEFKQDELIIYCSIDSWIPHELSPFLSKGKEPKEYNGVKGERLKTIKLKGALSQGLILPLSVLPENYDPLLIQEGIDVTDILGIQKWELPETLTKGNPRGNFPMEIPKTDQTRIQSLTEKFEIWKSQEDRTWTIEEKLDGSSMTVACIHGNIHVCSRNLSLKEDGDNNNTFWTVAKKQNLNDIVMNHYNETNTSIALQGELCGPGIQGNPYKLTEHKFFLFDIWDIDNQRYFSANERYDFANINGIQSVPVINSDYKLNNDTIDSLLEMAEDKSVLCKITEREGLVFKCNEDPSSTFKVISNKFLLKGGN
jgi:RNA ligase (TIGR02306 family)